MADEISSSTLPMRVLDEVFSHTGDDLAVSVLVRKVERNLGVAADKIGSAVKSLARKQLVEPTLACAEEGRPSAVFITREGVALAKMRSAARVSTDAITSRTAASALQPVLPPPWRTTPVHIPALDLAGEAVVTRTRAGAATVMRAKTATVALGDSTARQAREFLHWFDKYRDFLRDEVGSGRADDIAGDVETLRTQINSLNPKPQLIKPVKDAIQVALQDAGGGAVAAGLFHYVREINL